MPQLGTAARAHIKQVDNEIFVSAASAWEIEIKRTLGKLEAPDDLALAIEASDFQMLSISMSHVVTTGRLPRHHDDPFDRMLIGQALVDQLTVVTRDPAFQQYKAVLIPADA